MAAQMITGIAEHLPEQTIHGQADAAYHNKILQNLPTTVTWTTRVPRNAVFYGLTPPRTGHTPHIVTQRRETAPWYDSAGHWPHAP